MLLDCDRSDSLDIEELRRFCRENVGTAMIRFVGGASLAASEGAAAGGAQADGEGGGRRRFSPEDWLALCEHLRFRFVKPRELTQLGSWLCLLLCRPGRARCRQGRPAAQSQSVQQAVQVAQAVNKAAQYWAAKAQRAAENALVASGGVGDGNRLAARARRSAAADRSRARLFFKSPGYASLVSFVLLANVIACTLFNALEGPQVRVGYAPPPSGNVGNAPCLSLFPFPPPRCEYAH